MKVQDYHLEPPAPPKSMPCPVCGSEFYQDIYKGMDGIVGCDDCVNYMPAEEWWQELEEIQMEEIF